MASALATPPAQLIKLWRPDPVTFVRSAYAGGMRPDPAQRRILDAVGKHSKVAVRSAHGVGKTTTAAWLVHWWLSTRYPALVVTLAGTWGLLEQKLWPTIHSTGAKLRQRRLFDWQQMAIFGRMGNVHDNDWRAEASSSDKPENIEGWHSPHLLIVVDEAKAMPDSLYEAIRGAMSTGELGGNEVKILVLSTPPTRKVGWFCDLWDKRSAGWTLLHVSAEESSLVDPDWITEMETDFGRESPVFQAKVLGEIPDSGEMTLITAKWFEMAQLLPARKDPRPTVLSMDVAREGEDLTVIGRFQNKKFTFFRFADGRPGWKATNTIPEAIRMAKDAILEANAAIMVVDDSGVGGGVTDGLNMLQRDGKIPRTCSIVPVKFGSSPQHERYHTKKDELYWTAREALRRGKLALPNDAEIRAMGFPRGSDFRAQLLSPVFEAEDKTRVYDKRVGNTERTKTLPTKSPDLAHAFILGARYYLLQRGEALKPKPTNTVEQFEAQIRKEMDARKRNRKPPGDPRFRRSGW